MSVLACDRRGCTNIMCDRLSACGRYYICNSCFEEIIRLGVATSVEEFMDSQKRESRNDPEAARAYFDKQFPLMEDNTC